MSMSIAQLPIGGGNAVFVLRLLLATTVAWLLAAGLNVIFGRSSASLRHRVWSMSMAAALALPALLVFLPHWQVAHIAVEPDAASEAPMRLETAKLPTPIDQHDESHNLPVDSHDSGEPAA